MLSSKIAEVSGGEAAGSPLTILAAVTGGKNRIYKLILTANATTNLAVSDGFGTYYAIAGVPVILDYGEFGKLQTTSDTLISVTPSAAASVGILVQYENT